MARNGKENGRWVNGRSATYRRNVTNAKPGELVHHINGDKSDNRASNFSKLKPGKYVTAVGLHNKLHPEKGKKK